MHACAALCDPYRKGGVHTRRRGKVSKHELQVVEVLLNGQEEKRGELVLELDWSDRGRVTRIKYAQGACPADLLYIYICVCVCVCKRGIITNGELEAKKKKKGINITLE